MTLTEFLLARIAEDEAVSFRIISDPRNPGYVGHECLICPDGRSFGGTVRAITEIAEEHAEGIHGRSRALAECEAKRRIVEAHREPMILFGGHESWHFDLKYLAAVYADHPDYDETWKP